MRVLKDGIKRLLAVAGYDILRMGEYFDRPFDALSYVARDYLTRHPEGCFVEIGGADGIESDGLYPLVAQFHLKGLIVEPLPDQFQRLRQNYAGQPQVALENCAIATTEGARTLYYFQRHADIPDWAYGMASFHKQHLTKFRNTAHLGRHIREAVVPTLTFTGLLRKHHVTRVDLLCIDTEGYDYEILKMAFAAGLRPAIINYEHQHLKGHDYLASKQLLVQQGYRFIRYGRDILALRDEETAGRHQ